LISEPIDSYLIYKIHQVRITVQGKGIKTVIIIGFSHRQYFDGISVYAKGSWKTPLGDISIDEALAGQHQEAVAEKDETIAQLMERLRTYEAAERSKDKGPRATS